MSAAIMYYPNPGEDFVLRGGQPSYYSEMPGFLRNSMITDTTKNLTQHTYNSERYGDDPQIRGKLRTLSRSLTRVKGNITKSLLNEDATLSTRDNTSMSQIALNEALRDSMNRNPPSGDLLTRSDWYAKPIHHSDAVNIPMSTDDVLASYHFPVTLGELKSLEMLEDVHGAKSENKKKKQRPQTAGSRHEVRRLDNTFYLTAEAPNIKNSVIRFTSPYSDELSKLRLEKLRIEEAQYLELKRQAELELVRGPRPKWYSIKGPTFHIEAKKNNELLKNSDKWDDLLTYRERLITATKRLQKALQEDGLAAY